MSKNKQNLIEDYNNLQTTINELEEKIKSFDKAHQIVGSAYLENLKHALSLLRPSFTQMVNSNNSEEAANTQIFKANYCNIEPLIDNNISNFIKVNKTFRDLTGYSTPVTFNCIKSHSVDLTSNKALAAQLAPESKLKELEQLDKELLEKQIRLTTAGTSKENHTELLTQIEQQLTYWQNNLDLAKHTKDQSEKEIQECTNVMGNATNLYNQALTTQQNISRNNYYETKYVRVKHKPNVLKWGPVKIKDHPYYTEEPKTTFNQARYDSDINQAAQTVALYKQTLDESTHKKDQALQNCHIADNNIATAQASINILAPQKAQLERQVQKDNTDIDQCKEFIDREYHKQKTTLLQQQLDLLKEKNIQLNEQIEYLRDHHELITDNTTIKDPGTEPLQVEGETNKELEATLGFVAQMSDQGIEDQFPPEFNQEQQISSSHVTETPRTEEELDIHALGLSPEEIELNFGPL